MTDGYLIDGMTDEKWRCDRCPEPYQSVEVCYWCKGTGYRMIYDERATRIMQTIFGDDVIRRVLIEPGEISLKDDGECNSSSLVLELVNGRSVRFWNSEWGGLEDSAPFADYRNKNS